MDKIKLLETTKSFSKKNYITAVYNKLLSACIEYPIPSQKFSRNLKWNLQDIFIEETEKRDTLSKIAVAICTGETREDKIDKLLSGFDKEYIYNLGRSLLYDFGIKNSFVNEYPHIVSIAITNKNAKTESLQIHLTEGINRVNLCKYKSEYSAETVASAIMWCLRGIPSEIINDVSSEYFLSESAKERLLSGKSKTETVIAKLTVESSDGCFCGADAKAEFELKDGKIISDFYTDSREEKTAEAYFKGLWNNTFISKFGVKHGNISEIIAHARSNRFPVLIDLSEVETESVLTEILSLKNQIVIFETDK